MSRYRHPRRQAGALKDPVENELTFRQMVDGISALFAVLTPDGAVENVNRGVLDYFGKTLEELKVWTSTDAVHRDDLPDVIAVWGRSLESGEPYDVELRQRRADGVYRWFRVQGLPVKDAEGRILRWCVLQTDIDERKRAECMLAGENLVLEMIAKGSPLESVLEAVCRVVERTTSGSFSSVVVFDSNGSTIQEVVAPSLPSSYNDRLPGAPVDREAGPCRSTPILASNGLVLGSFAIYWREPRSPTEQDRKIIEQMTHLAAVAIERKRDEGALSRAFDEIARSEAELRTIIDAIPQLIIAIGAAGQFLYANQAVMDYTGLTEEEVRTQRFGDVFHLEDSERLRDQRGLAISRTLPFEYERRVRRRDGRYRWLLVQYNPLLDERGEVIRWYATGTDIDERKRAEEALRESEHELRQLIDSVPSMIAVADSKGHSEYLNKRAVDYLDTTVERKGTASTSINAPSIIWTRRSRDSAVGRWTPFIRVIEICCRTNGGGPTQSDSRWISFIASGASMASTGGSTFGGSPSATIRAASSAGTTCSRTLTTSGGRRKRSGRRNIISDSSWRRFLRSSRARPPKADWST
jgi:PAS domain S-box-containing protein